MTASPITHHSSLKKPAGFFVAGTDTGVGKTLVACALLHAFAASGRRVTGMKPVAAGCDVTGRNGDVVALQAAGNVAADDALINPYRFTPPVAPHAAAEEAGVGISLEAIANAFHALAARADLVVVEGVGGFRVPLNAREDTADLAVRLALPVVLVVGMRLGCLNHALLTAEAVRARGLTLAGWVANTIDPQMERADASIAALEARLAAPLVARLPYFAPCADARRCAAAFDLMHLR